MFKMIRFFKKGIQKNISIAKQLLQIDIRWELYKKYFKKRSIITFFSDHGCSLELYPGEHVSDAIHYRKFEVEVCNFIKKVLCPGMVFFDIGANIGFYTIIAGTILKGSGEVHSFEPSKREFNRLTRNVVLNELTNVHLNRVAILDRESERSLFICDDTRAAYNSVYTVTHPDAADAVICKENIRCTTIDAYARNGNIKKIDLIKMDIEGAEFLALKGSVNALNSNPAPIVVFECTECFTQQNKDDKQKQFNKLREIFQKHNYSIYEFIPNEGALQIVDQQPVRNGWNFVAIKARGGRIKKYA